MCSLLFCFSAEGQALGLLPSTSSSRFLVGSPWCLICGECPTDWVCPCQQAKMCDLYTQISLLSPQPQTSLICLFPPGGLVGSEIPLHLGPWTEFKKRYLLHCLLHIHSPSFFTPPPPLFGGGFLCVLKHSNTRLFPRHSSFVYLSFPVTDLCLSVCSDSTFSCDYSLCYASFRVLVLKPLVLCKVTELPH